MRVLRRVALVVAIAVVAVAAFTAWNVYGAWPVPEGFAFPRHSIWNGGPDALYAGSLHAEDGCIVTDAGETVIWPPFSSLGIVDGDPVIRMGGREVAMGATVELGGGWYDRAGAEAIAPDVAAWDCPTEYFLTWGVPG